MQNKVEKNAAQYQKMSDKHDRTSLFSSPRTPAARNFVFERHSIFTNRFYYIWYKKMQTRFPEENATT